MRMLEAGNIEYEKTIGMLKIVNENFMDVRKK